MTRFRDMEHFHVTLKEFEDALRRANFLPEEGFRARAKVLHEDLAALQMHSFRLLPFSSFPVPELGMRMPLSEYSFGDEDHSIDNAMAPATIKSLATEMDGTALDREELLYLGQVCQLARQKIPLLWKSDKELSRDFVLPTKHLNTLNEIWWLKLWEGIDVESVRRDPRIRTDSSKRVDWRFSLLKESLYVNLEVKRFERSSADRAYDRPQHFYRNEPAGKPRDKDNPRWKFPPSGENEINVLGITWLDVITNEFEREIQTYVDEVEEIDVVLLWAFGDRRRGGWHRQCSNKRNVALKQKLLNAVLREPDGEDRARVISQRAPRTQKAIERDEFRFKAPSTPS